MNLTEEQHKEWARNYLENVGVEYSDVYEDYELEELDADEDDWLAIYDLTNTAKVTVTWED